jgi:hypothetical protein
LVENVSDRHKVGLQLGGCLRVRFALVGVRLALFALPGVQHGIEPQGLIAEFPQSQFGCPVGGRRTVLVNNNRADAVEDFLRRRLKYKIVRG